MCLSSDIPWTPEAASEDELLQMHAHMMQAIALAKQHSSPVGAVVVSQQDGAVIATGVCSLVSLTLTLVVHASEISSFTCVQG